MKLHEAIISVISTSIGNVSLHYYVSNMYRGSIRQCTDNSMTGIVFNNFIFVITSHIPGNIESFDPDVKRYKLSKLVLQQ